MAKINLQTQTSRARLAPRGRPYQGRLIPGVHLGYRAAQSGTGAWVVIAADGKGAQWQKVIGHADWLEDPNFSTPDARLPKLAYVFAEIEKWTMTMNKMDVMATLNPLNVPNGPILSMKELAEEQALRETGTVVEVDHPERGKYLTVGNPIKLSDSPAVVRRSPLLGEHTDEVLRTVLGLDDKEIHAARLQGAI